MNIIKDYSKKILTYTEQFTKTDITYFTKNGSWLLGGSLTKSSLSFLLAIAYANLLTKYNYGIYQFILTTSAFLAIPTLAGINTSVTKSVSQGKEQIIRQAFQTRFRWGFIGSLIGILISLYYWFNDNYILGSSFLITSLFIPIFNPPSVYTSYLQGKRKFFTLTCMEVSNHFFSVISLLLTLFLTNNILALVFVYFASMSLSRFLSYKKVLRLFPPNTTKDESMITYGKHITLTQIMSSISGVIDKLLLWYLLGPIQLAIYVFSQSVPNQTTSLIKIINRIAFPKFSEKVSIHNNNLPKKIGKTFFITIPLLFAYIVVCPFIYHTFFPQYIEAIPFAQILSLIFILQPFSLLITYLTATGKIKSLYVFNIQSHIVKIILFISLIPFWGLTGAIFSLILSKVSDTIVAIYLYNRQ